MTYLIAAPPPTPNGDLHLGHLSGPYLGADIFKRLLKQRGINTYYSVSTDDNQSYVEKTAIKLSVDAGDLLRDSRAKIAKTLEVYSIDVDCFGKQESSYEEFVKNFFSDLYKFKQISICEVDVLYDRIEKSYPVEAFVTGYCPHCFDVTCGGICETCGHPNSGVDLLGIDRRRYEIRKEQRLVLDIESMHQKISDHLQKINSHHRPALEKLLDSLLSKSLDPFILSYKIGTGIDAEFIDLKDQQINVWGEMYPGHMYFFGKEKGYISPDNHYVQFLGFDNSYFYTLVHLSLAIAARESGYDWPLPSAFITNQFYNLEANKFSTSKGHLIWARNLARDIILIS
ncbi:class I tRNA ligase family protein [Endozoicomonas sp. ALB115]|uniref:class I tRNA ligase family protein n=1 Tax=Endozoicomonas sp. ALB115 TaxID=3403074 RepID=UPI003BB59E54